MSYVRTKFSSAVMAESVSKGFLASLHAERLLRGKQHAKTAPLPASAAEVSGLAINEASPIEVKPLTKQASLLSFFQKETPAPMAGLRFPSHGSKSWN